MFSLDAMAALPYGTVKPTAHALFKSVPEDFVVNEVLGYDLPVAEQNEHLWLQIEKRGQNTAWVAKQLAKHFARPDVDVSYAGLKDRHAVTTQWFSLRLGAEEKLASLAIEGVRVLQHCLCNRKLKRGALEANQFAIRLRNVSDGPALLAAVTAVNQQGAPNYFAEQRFGHNAGNILLAQRWFQNKYRPRGKTERGLLISAMRSWLFNLQVAKGFELGELAGYLPGKSRDPEPSLLQAACAGYEKQRVWLAKLGCSLHQRDIRVMPNITVEPVGDDMLLSMTLPAGCYATAVLREIVCLD